MAEYARILKNDPTLVQKIGNGNNQYTKEYSKGGKATAAGGGGSSAISAIKKLHPNAGGVKAGGNLPESVSNTGIGAVPEVHKALEDAGFKKVKTVHYSNGKVTTASAKSGTVSTHYKHSDGSKAKVNEHAPRPESKHSKDGNFDYHVGVAATAKKSAATRFDGV